MSLEFETETVEVDECIPNNEIMAQLESTGPLTYIEASSSTFSTESMVSCRICKGCRGHDLVPSPCNCKGIIYKLSCSYTMVLLQFLIKFEQVIYQIMGSGFQTVEMSNHIWSHTVRCTVAVYSTQ